MIYFIGSINNPQKIKIGRAKDVDKRIKQLQTGNPEKLINYISLSERQFSEKEIHNLFQSTRVSHDNNNKDSEWFRCPTNSRLWKFINGKAKITRNKKGKVELKCRQKTQSKKQSTMQLMMKNLLKVLLPE